jgi:predicted DNA-binding transcriptional regulator AlpA
VTLQLKWQARQQARRLMRKEWRRAAPTFQAKPEIYNAEHFSTKEVAALLDMSPETIRKWRAKNYGPQFSKQLDGSVVYEKRDIEAWLEKNNA